MIPSAEQVSRYSGYCGRWEVLPSESVTPHSLSPHPSPSPDTPSKKFPGVGHVLGTSQQTEPV